MNGEIGCGKCLLALALQVAQWNHARLGNHPRQSLAPSRVCTHASPEQEICCRRFENLLAWMQRQVSRPSALWCSLSHRPVEQSKMIVKFRSEELEGICPKNVGATCIISKQTMK